MDLMKINEELNRYLHLQSVPVAIKLCQSIGDVPPEAQFPRKDLGFRMTTCQVIGMVRKRGGVLAFTKGDSNCAPGSITLGFAPAVDFYLKGGICAGIYTETMEAGERSEAAVARFSPGEYEALVMATLLEAPFEPDILLVYGNPAQVMRLIHAACYKRGGVLLATLTGRLGCAQEIVRTAQTQECQFVLPGNGERIIGHTQDHEVVFSIPASQLDEILEGLEKTHQANIRYPIRSYLSYEVVFPPPYQELMAMLE